MKVKKMLKNSLIIVPFQLPWDRPADFQRQTCLELAKKNLVVAYLHNDARFFLKPRPVKKLPKHRNLIFYQPRYIIPLRRLTLIEKLNQLLNLWYLLVRYGRGRERSILWLFDPAFWFYPRLKSVFAKLISLYDCVDYVWHRSTSMKKKLQAQEKQLIKNVDYFFVNSQVLAKLHSPTRQPTAIMPQGFRLKDFKKPKPAKVKFLQNKPIIGYVGALDHRLDFKLLQKLIKNNPQWLFVLWGPVREEGPAILEKTKKAVDKIRALPNIIIGKSTDRREVPSIIKQFDVCIIPYDTKLASVRYSYPMKLFEYFYLGKPVVSAPLPALASFKSVIRPKNTANEWQSQIKKLLNSPWPTKNKRVQRQLATANSWKQKIATISDTIKK
jgi:hypothetical protein